MKLKIFLAGLVGGVLPIGAIVVPTIATIDWVDRWETLVIGYVISFAVSAGLYWMKSPAGREIWTDAEREALRSK